MNVNLAKVATTAVVPTPLLTFMKYSLIDRWLQLIVKSTLQQLKCTCNLAEKVLFLNLQLLCLDCTYYIVTALTGGSLGERAAGVACGNCVWW